MDGTFSLGLRPDALAPAGRINVHVARLQECSLPVRPEKESEAHETTLLERKLEKGGRRAPSGVGILLGMIPIQIPGLPSFSLGMAGGPLLVGVLVAHFGPFLGNAA